MSEARWRREELEDGRGVRLRIERGGVPLPYAEVLRLWRDDDAFAERWSEVLAETGAGAFKWETPPVTRAMLDRPFECVLLDAGWLEMPPDTQSFAEHFRTAPPSEHCIAFPNLGGDAWMVVPTPHPDAPASVYPHLASFLRGAPVEQRRALWRVTAEEMLARVGDRPIWLSTAGGGVAWVHVRLDDRPKYYGYGPYREPPD